MLRLEYFQSALHRDVSMQTFNGLDFLALQGYSFVSIGSSSRRIHGSEDPKNHFKS